MMLLTSLERRSSGCNFRAAYREDGPGEWRKANLAPLACFLGIAFARVAHRRYSRREAVEGGSTAGRVCGRCSNPPEREEAMAEQEPKVAPIIRLPQIRAERGAPDSKPPGFFVEPGKKASGPGDGGEADELLEDEAPPPSLKSQISGDQSKLSGDTGVLRAGVSTILRRALLNFAEQERQRTWLVTILLAAQAAILLAVLPGYIFGSFQLAGVLVTLGGLALLGIIWLLNWMGRTAEASFLLVVGGMALVALDMLLSAAHLVSLETLHIALLFMLVILSGGILFSPETALILAIISATFTALVALLFRSSGALAADFAAQGRYLSLVYLVMTQIAVGVVGWLFGRQMQESVHLITYVSGLQMSNKGLRKRLRETNEKKRHLEAGLAIIQQTHARVAAGDYSARAHVEGELLPLAVSLNLMLERVESFVHGEYERERMETAVAGLAELAGRVGEESQGRLPVPTGTALDGLSIAIKQMQTNVNQRLAKVQQSAAALMATVGRCQDGLLPVAEVLEEHLRSVDALVIAADNIMTSAQRQIEFATQAEQLLLAAAPAGVDLKVAEENAQQRVGTSALRLAEEIERRAALAGTADAPSAEPQAASAELREAEAPPAVEAPPAEDPVIPVEEQATEEAAALPAEEQMDKEEPAATLTNEEQAAEEPAPQPAEPAPEPAANAEETTAQESEAAVETPAPEASAEADAAAPEGEAPLPMMAEADEQAEEAPALAGDEAPIVAEEKKITLADVDREAAEEEDQRQGLDWDVGQLRDLVQVLSSMAGEATRQERNARTMTFKLRAMLQGMPTTRRVDMMAAWLRAALEAVSQSATEVQQASKTIPASAFQGARKERADSPAED
jgi:hypothetical protein